MSDSAATFRLSRCEKFLIAYFLYTSAVALIRPLPEEIVSRTLLVNLSVIAGLLTLAAFASARPWPALGVARNLLPLALVMLAYQQMGSFALPHNSTALEEGWVIWDRALLDNWGLRNLIELFGPPLPALLEFSYLLTYAVGPAAILVLYRNGAESRADRFLLAYTLGTMLAYAMFPYFPSETPRTLFPGDLFPTVDTVFRQLNWRLLAAGGITTSVFPSGHVASVFAGALGMFAALPERPWVGRSFLIYAALVFIATVYGRYHYFVDGAAGVAAAFVAAAAVGVAFEHEPLPGMCRRPAP